MIISFEGVDGTGKSTQAQLLQKYLSEQHNIVYYTQEPGWDSEVSEMMRALIKSSKTSSVQKLFLLLADRAAHFDQRIGPVLSDRYRRSQQIVIMDRGIDSTIAYQGFGQLLTSIPWLVEANKIATSGMIPDITFLMDMDSRDSLRRVGKENLYEGDGALFYDRVRNGFNEIAATDKSRVITIDASKSREECQREILKAFKSRFSQNSQPSNISSF